MQSNRERISDASVANQMSFMPKSARLSWIGTFTYWATGSPTAERACNSATILLTCPRKWKACPGAAMPD